MNDAEPAPGSMPRRIEARPLFVMRLDIGEIQKIGGSPVGRQVGVINSGRFAGARLSGRVLGGGSDWQSLRSDGSVLLDCRLVLETADGALIAMTYTGIRAGAADVMARLTKGEAVDAAEYYFRTNPLFYTASPRYDWLNNVVGIGVGHRLPEGPVYSVFEIL